MANMFFMPIEQNGREGTEGNRQSAEEQLYSILPVWMRLHYEESKAKKYSKGEELMWSKLYGEKARDGQQTKIKEDR